MEPSKEPISVRITRMNNMIMGKTPKSLVRREGLIDSLLVLYDECNSDTMKKDPNIAAFVDKFRSAVSEIRSMRVNINDFEVRKVIGRGHFGEVHLVREKQTGDAYAMKTLRKSDTLGNKRAFFENERDVMTTAVSPWITSLQYAFQDMHNLYLVMEFQPGGDLLALLDRFGGHLSEEFSKFYLAEITSAIRSLHQMGYVHRDIKPDNILLDRCGHIKLADFGSSARLSSAGLVQTEMPVGTPEYLAPEVLQGVEATESKGKSRVATSRSPPMQILQCYGAECDFWSLGIVAYEIIFGKTPFRSDQLATTYQNILSHKKYFKFPEHIEVSEDFKDLVSGLITDANCRLTYDHLVKHPFFGDVEWVSLRDVVPPQVPVVNGEDDTSNFFEYERVQLAPSIESFKSHKEFSGKNLPFVGFTYAKDPSVTPNGTVDPHLERKLDAKKKEIHGLLSKIHALEGTSGRKNQDTESLKKRAETAEQRLELIELDRSRLESELARSRSELQSLRRSLDLEMQETKNMEARAMELIKSAKEKWDRLYAKEHKEKDKKIDQLTDQLTALNTSNNNLISKLLRRDKELAHQRSEMSNLQELVKEYKDNMAKTRQSQRESVIGVQSRLNELATESQNQLLELQAKFDSESRKFEQYKAQVDRKRQEFEDALEKSHLEIKSLNEQLREKSSQVKNLEHTRIAELERKIQKGCSKCALWQDRIAALESELSASVMSFEQHENTIAEREEERYEAVAVVSREKAELEQRLQDSVFKEEENREKLANLEKLMQSLEGSITKLEEENSKLREQNSALAKYKRRSSIGAHGPVASPRAATTTTVTTTTIVAALAEASVEPACDKKDDDSNHLQLQVLEANITKLESQLDKAKEAAILDRQAAQTARTDLWRKEKELSGVKLDLRIAEREVKKLEDELKDLQSEKVKLEEDMKKEKDMRKVDKEKITQLTKELEMVQAELQQDKLSSSALTSTLASYRSDLNTKESKIKELQIDLTAAKRQVKLLELQVSKTDETCHELRDEKKRLLQQLDESQRSLQRLEVNSNVLKETCTMLEDQLVDYERLTSTHEAKEARLQEECSKLHADIDVIQSEIRLSKQALNEEKSLRAQAEIRAQILETQLEESEANLTQAREQVSEYKSLAERLTDQVNSSDEQASTLEVSLHSAQRQIANLHAEVVGLKEEVATQLTRIHTLKETNLRLDQELEESVQEEKALLERVERLQSTIAEMEACHAHRQLKSDATLQQQVKLIDYLQQKLEEQGRRKKTLTDKLFGKRDNKENQMNSANIINAGMKELESQLLQERKKVQKLTEEIVRSSTRCPKSTSQDKEKEKSQNCTPEDEVLSPTTAKHLVLSPASQAIKSQASLQRMHHNIPHRFEVKVMVKPAKCAACQDGLPFGRQAAVCVECGAVAHHRCTGLLPSTCGLPSGFARHFSQRWKKSREGEAAGDRSGAVCPAAVNIEGWMKLPTRGNTCWERRYVRLAGSELLIFAHEPGSGSAQMAPIERFPLCPADGAASVTSATQSEVVGTAKSDVPFIIKVDVTPRTTCWPGSSQYLMALSAMDKEKWIEALKTAIRAGEAMRGSMPVDVSRRYCGQVMVRLPQEKKLDIACIMHINHQVVLFGAEEGLFSYHLGKDKPKPVKIGGIGSVYQMAVMSQYGKVIMIAGRNRELLYCEYGQLKACAEAAECSQAVLSTKPVFAGSSNCAESCFQLLAVSKHRESATTSDILCAASAKKLVILKWNSTSSGSFQQLKVLETQEPCSCILLMPHSVIVGCNKFFEIDAQDFSVEDFLDVSDKSLSHLVTLAKKTNSFPLAILDVTSSGSRCSPEYLACFHEIGVFVDQYGRRSREEDIKWGHVPFAFAYCKPFLFIFHFASVEVMRLSGTSFTRNLNDSGSTLSDSPPTSVIELNNPQYLGDTLSSGAVYASNAPANGLEVVRIEGALACPEELGYSCSSLETASDNRDDIVMREVRDAAEFSFTSSIVQSLEGSEEETDDARSSTDSQSTSHSEIHSRHVQFRKVSTSTLHTAM